MPEPLDIAALRETAEAIEEVPYIATLDPERPDEAILVRGIVGESLAGCPDCGTTAEFDDVDARYIAAFSPDVVLALLSEVSRGRALEAAVKGLADRDAPTKVPLTRQPYTKGAVPVLTGFRPSKPEECNAWWHEQLRALLAAHDTTEKP